MTPVATRRRLGATDLHVHPLNLGGNVFGWTADRDTSFAVLDAYRAAGGNFVDTADVYSAWVLGHSGGESEETLGAWLKDRGCRREMIVATKIGAGGPGLGAGLSADQIRRGCDLSLKRLGVDAIDLYYAHRDDADTPLEETLTAFDALIRAGKVRWIGASNFTAARLEGALETSERNGLARYAVVQPEYNLLARDGFEGALADLCQARGLGVCTYYALASGFLTGKYGGPDGPPATPRAARVAAYLAEPRAVAILEAVRSIARRRAITPAQVAIAWQLHRPAVTTPIASATGVSQVEELMAAVTVSLDRHDLAELDAPIRG